MSPFRTAVHVEHVQHVLLGHVLVWLLLRSVYNPLSETLLIPIYTGRTSLEEIKQLAHANTANKGQPGQDTRIQDPQRRTPKLKAPGGNAKEAHLNFLNAAPMRTLHHPAVLS